MPLLPTLCSASLHFGAMPNVTAKKLRMDNPPEPRNPTPEHSMASCSSSFWRPSNTIKSLSNQRWPKNPTQPNPNLGCPEKSVRNLTGDFREKEGSLRLCFASPGAQKAQPTSARSLHPGRHTSVLPAKRRGDKEWFEIRGAWQKCASQQVD